MSRPLRLMAALIGLAVATEPAHAAWLPAQEEPFDAQVSAPYDLVRPVKAIVLDLFETSPARLQELRSRGARTICSINAGAWEGWRPDAHAYDLRAVGSGHAGWQGERWVDVRAASVVRPILGKRLDLCRGKGFDGVLLENLDGHAHRTGFPLTAEDQLAFGRWLAAEARGRGLAVGLKGALGLVAELVDHFDFAVAESCFSGQRCGVLAPFREAGKAVFVIEHTNVRRKMDSFCAAAAELDVQLVFKTKSLNGKLHRRCP